MRTIETRTLERSEQGALSALDSLRPSLVNAGSYLPPFTDPSLVNLTLNEHFAEPSPAVQQILSDPCAAEVVRYATGANSLLIREIAQLEQVSEEQVLISNGSSSALTTLFSAISAGSVLLPSLCWTYYEQLATSWGHTSSRYPVTRDTQGFEVDLRSAATDLLNAHHQLAVIINPHMPTGSLSSREDILALVKADSQTLVLVDEAYQGFSIRAESMASYADDHPNLVVSKTFSKFFGLAGIRLGYLIGHPALIEQLSKISPLFGISGIAAATAVAAIRDISYYEAQAVIMRDAVNGFANRISGLQDVAMIPSHGNFFLMEFREEELAADAAEAIRCDGIAVRSASSYGLHACLRVSVGQPDVMQRVANVLERLFA